jgi:hypothetical protein
MENKDRLSTGNKRPRNKLTKEVKELYNENYKLLKKKKSKKTTEDEKNSHTHGLADSIL